MSAVVDFFARDYAEARRKFCAAVEAVGGGVESFNNTAYKGPAGETLYTDVVRFGPREARKLLWINSGTHGVEGFCGSGIQGALLAGGLHKRLPADTALVISHALNPCGFAWTRRVNESNIDLNRNFVDFANPPKNDGYDRVHPFLLPDAWEGPARDAADARLGALMNEMGLAAFQAAVSGGQYNHPDGIFYGGAKPSWSHKTFLKIGRRFGDGAGVVAFIDLHTGLGPSGHGELIYFGGAAETGRDLATGWIGADQVKCPEAGDSVSADLDGTLDGGLRVAFPAAERVPVAIEYGTLPIVDVLTALRADNWLHLRGGRDHPLWDAIKSQVRAAFFTETDQWMDQVVARADWAIDRTLKGLAAS